MKVEVKILLQISMNSINNSWDSIKLTFVSVPKVRKKMKEKGKQEKKNMRMNASKENTPIYIHMYIYTHPWAYKYIFIQIHKCKYTNYSLFKSDSAF